MAVIRLVWERMKTIDHRGTLLRDTASWGTQSAFKTDGLSSFTINFQLNQYHHESELSSLRHSRIC